ncbi:MAG: cyclic nucleotide-binding domain-containing protein, partial [Gammaproteobacteria bacterium]
VDVELNNGGDQARHIATLGPGEVFGEIGFVRPMPRTASIIAREHVQALRYDYDRVGKDLRFFTALVAKLNFNISVILGERLAKTIEEQNATVRFEPES